MDVVEDFVLQGGRLVFLGEHNLDIHPNNVVVGGRFGIEYPPEGTEQPEVFIDVFQPHPITDGPFGRLSFIDGSINSPGCFGSMTSPGPNGISVMEFAGGNSGCVVIEPEVLGPNSGLVVAVAEVCIWFNSEIVLADNRAFWRNIFAYSPTGPVGVEAHTWGGIKSRYRQ
jgi:hypothetical protein